ncbi:MAG: substrate-binding domain-containing protein, partial [Pseudomonadota bacterium]
AFFDQTVTNPASKLTSAIRAFDTVAPAVSLDVSLEPPNVIEAGVVSGRYDIGIVPIHRNSSVLTYIELYSENMLLYCGHSHPLFDASDAPDINEHIRASKYAGLSFNSPNMIVGQRKRLTRSAEVQDEEALAMLILSGRYIGFLPDHAAQAFVDRGEMRAIGGKSFCYNSRHAAIVRKNHDPSRVLSEFMTCLTSAHSIGRS